MATTLLALEHETPAKFWERQDEDLARRMSEPEIASETFNLLLREDWERKPIHKQTSIYELAELAEDRIEQKRLSIMRAAARRGGSARKSDPLTLEIEEIVAVRPAINLEQLLVVLEARKSQGVIHDVTETTIVFANSDGKITTAAVSGLKHRLDRVRKRLKSRKALRAN
jgi:hypothetical protein